MIELFINLMILQALMGAFDTIYHHELKVALPRCPSARLELAIHSVRAIFYGILFYGLAWYEWSGLWVWVLIGIILIEIGLTLWDFVVEDATRLLPNSERITHTLLAINGGAIFILLATELPAWLGRETAFIAVDYGWQSWFLTVSAIGVISSGIRDGLAAWTVQRLDLRLGIKLDHHRRFLITGGTGFIGSALCRELIPAGHDITLLTRNPIAASIQFGGKVRAITDTDELSAKEKFDVIVNLAGAPVVGLPWTSKRKRDIAGSRINATKQLMRFVHRAIHYPETWIQASAIGYYGTQTMASYTEQSTVGEGFAATMCQSWEGLSTKIEAMNIRRVVLRFGLVFGRSGGALPMMLLPFRLGLGAIIGDGNQKVGWIHIEDLIRLISRAIADDSLRGKINAVAPDSPSYQQFAKAIGKQLQRPVWFRIPAIILRKSLGEMASMFVDGPRIEAKRLKQIGFEFRFPNLRTALMDLT